MQVHISGQMTEGELREAIALNSRSLRRLSAIGLAVVVVVMIFGLLSSDNPGSDFSSAIPLVVLGLLFSYPLYLPHLQAARMNTSILIKNRIEGTITQETLSWWTTDFDMNLSWSELRSYKMTDTMVLLYRENQIYTPFSRALFNSDTDWRTFTDYVVTRTPPSEGLRARLVTILALALAAAIVVFAFYNSFIV